MYLELSWGIQTGGIAFGLPMDKPTPDPLVRRNAAAIAAERDQKFIAGTLNCATAIKDFVNFARYAIMIDPCQSPSLPAAPQVSRAWPRENTRMDMARAALARHSPRVLFASAEAYPLAKTGGLGDVAGALPTALAKLGIDIRVILPGYVRALDLTEDKQALLSLPEGGRLISGRMPNSGVSVYLLDRPDLFRRRGGLYQDSDKRDWPDNHIRYGVFCDAVTHITQHGDSAGWRPDMVHANDWHTGLVPARLRLESTFRPPTLFTIHNMAFQGNFPLQVAENLGLPANVLTDDGAEFFGQLSFLKAAIRYSDRLTTVSPTYAREILTPEHGAGLDGVLRSRGRDLAGILNGIDYGAWSPDEDPNLRAPYCVSSMAGKATCKAVIQGALGLVRSDSIPLLAFVSRLTHQKMADVLLQALPALMNQEIQLAIHGEGENGLEEAFVAASRQWPSQMAVRIGYSESFAHQMVAAADIALTPARFEPCGLVAMYAMHYGTPPVARRVGGMNDTIIDITNGNAAWATGYTFTVPTAHELAACVQRACRGFSDKVNWRQIQRNAMQRDFSWNRAARQYAAVYRDLLPANTWFTSELEWSDGSMG